MSEDRKYYELFEDKSISDIFKEIHKNAANSRSNAKGMVDSLKKYVTSLESAVVISPLIQGYMEVIIRSDEQLIKLSDSTIRLIKEGKVASTEGPGFLSDDEKDQLLKEDVAEYEDFKKEEDENIKSLDERVESIKESLKVEETIEEEK